MAYNESYSCRKQGFPPSKENLQNGVFPHSTRESGHRYHTLHLNGGVLRGGECWGPGDANVLLRRWCRASER